MNDPVNPQTPESTPEPTPSADAPVPGGPADAPVDGSVDGLDPTTEAIQDVTAQVDGMAREAEAAARPVDLPDLSGSGDPGAGTGIGLLGDVDLDVRIELGRTRMLVDDVLKLSPESVVELDKAAGDPVDIYVNGRHVARGEVLVLNENFCVRVSEIVGRVPDSDAG